MHAYVAYGLCVCPTDRSVWARIREEEPKIDPSLSWLPLQFPPHSCESFLNWVWRHLWLPNSCSPPPDWSLLGRGVHTRYFGNDNIPDDILIPWASLVCAHSEGWWSGSHSGRWVSSWLLSLNSTNWRWSLGEHSPHLLEASCCFVIVPAAAVM